MDLVNILQFFFPSISLTRFKLNFNATVEIHIIYGKIYLQVGH